MYHIIFSVIVLWAMPSMAIQCPMCLLTKNTIEELTRKLAQDRQVLSDAEELHHRYTVLQQKNDGLRLQLESAQIENAQRILDIEGLLQERHRYTTTVEQQHTALKDSHATLQGSHTALRSSHASLQEINATLQNQVAEGRCTIDQLTQQVVSCRQTIEEQERALEALKKMTSEPLPFVDAASAVTPASGFTNERTRLLDAIEEEEWEIHEMKAHMLHQRKEMEEEERQRRDLEERNRDLQSRLQEFQQESDALRLMLRSLQDTSPPIQEETLEASPIRNPSAALSSQEKTPSIASSPDARMIRFVEEIERLRKELAQKDALIASLRGDGDRMSYNELTDEYINVCKRLQHLERTLSYLRRERAVEADLIP